MFTLLLQSIQEAHRTILKHQAGLTTLCVALVLPTRNPKQYLVCTVNVGDSLAFVYSKFHGIREITTGSHDIQSERDIRDAGGALGPVHGDKPELNNLTCSMTFADLGDIIYLTTDGISDNFDPVVTKIAVAKRVSPMKVHDDIDPIAAQVDESNGKETLTSGNNAMAESENQNDKGLDQVKSGESQTDSKGGNIQGLNGNQVIISQNSSQMEREGQVDSLNNMQQHTISGVTDSEKITEANGNDQESQDCKILTKPVTVNQSAKNKTKTCPSELNLKSAQSSIPTAGDTQKSAEGGGKGEVVKTGSKDTNPGKSSQRNAQTLGVESLSCGVLDGKPEMEPHERHCYAVKEMERIVLEYELFTEDVCCAQELCGALLQHVLKLTDTKRKVLENPNLYRRRVKKKDKEKRDSEIFAALGKAPGKLDHATIVAYEVGCFHGDEDEDYEKSDPEHDAFGSDVGPSSYFYNQFSNVSFETSV